MRITTLSENTAGRGLLLGEWGLSILVETDTATILFDTGKGISTVYNADTLGIDLRRIDKIVLSHGHMDHTGGLQMVLRRMKKKVEIIAHPDVWGAKWSKWSVRQEPEYRFLGIPFQRQELEGLGATFNLTAKPVTIGRDIITSGEVPMVTDFETIEPKLLIKVNGGWQPDKVMDDQALFISTELGLVVILGCAHRGLINTLYHAQKLTGVKKIHAVVGGSHLVDAADDRIALTIDALNELGVQRLGLCHCTSLPAAVRLSNEFGDRFFFNVTGTTINVL